MNFYCCNHHYISYILGNAKICISKIQYNKYEDEFYLISDHSYECQQEGIKSSSLVINNSKLCYKLSNLKNNLVIYLNNNPMIKYKEFKSYAEKELLKLDISVISNENFYILSMEK